MSRQRRPSAHSAAASFSAPARIAGACFIAACLNACGGTLWNTRQPATAPSYGYVDTSGTRLGSKVREAGAAHPGKSGFVLLHRGLDAFATRIALIDAADRSIDMQYYIFRDDTTGSLIIDRLLAAADRGVRVRLLLDDWGTSAMNDDDVAALDAHPNIEIRLFNPNRHRSGFSRLAELATNFARVNRRMHNKLLIADNQAAVIGGRNIGDEYFNATDVDFQDIDVLGAGPIANRCTGSFDAYWNSPFSVPIAELGRFDASTEKLASLSVTLRRFAQSRAGSPRAEAMADSDIARALRSRWPRSVWADASLLQDAPDKLLGKAEEPAERFLGVNLAAQTESVRSELLVVSSYFVPGPAGVEFFGRKVREKVRVRILTNTLAATDVWLVHAGYKKFRRPLLRAGVDLYELRPQARGDARIRKILGATRSSLHGKAFVYDRKAVFVGSLNIDPRSVRQNTEVGLLVYSRELAEQVAALFDRWTSPGSAYRVRLDRTVDGSEILTWQGERAGEPVTLFTEPEAGFWRRLGANLFSALPIESQL